MGRFNHYTAAVQGIENNKPRNEEQNGFAGVDADHFKSPSHVPKPRFQLTLSTNDWEEGTEQWDGPADAGQSVEMTDEDGSQTSDTAR